MRWSRLLFHDTGCFPWACISLEERAEADTSGKLGIQSRRSANLQPALQLFLKVLKIDGFGEARFAARLQNPLLLRHRSVCRHRNHGDFPKVRFLAHPCEEIEAVFGTQIDIEQDGVGKPLRKNLVTGLQVCRKPDLEPLHFEPVTEELAVELIVFHDEDAMFQAFSKA